ncbi:MAG: hypothetical protein HOW73_09435 [Polyangiaceae bacterium]|nr:hypothetical protein [Polyangiaceae bacterium]
MNTSTSMNERHPAPMPDDGRQRSLSAIARRCAFLGLAAVQVASFAAFIYAQRRADLAMDKTGRGDLAQFGYWNNVSDTPTWILAGAWMLAILFVPWNSRSRVGYVLWLSAGLPVIVVLGFFDYLALL